MKWQPNRLMAFGWQGVARAGALDLVLVSTWPGYPRDSAMAVEMAVAAVLGQEASNCQLEVARADCMRATSRDFLLSRLLEREPHRPEIAHDTERVLALANLGKTVAAKSDLVQPRQKPSPRVLGKVKVTHVDSEYLVR